MNDKSKETQIDKSKNRKLVLTRPKIHPIDDVSLCGMQNPEEVWNLMLFGFSLASLVEIFVFLHAYIFNEIHPFGIIMLHI